MNVLTKERREELQDIIQAKVPEFARDVMQAFEELLQAEQFWRLAVKNTPENDGNDGDGMGNPSCVFCNGEEKFGETTSHKPDCPWLIAQEDQ